MVTSQWDTHGTLKYKLYMQIFVKLRTISLSLARSEPIGQEDALTEKQMKQGCYLCPEDYKRQHCLVVLCRIGVLKRF